MENHRIIKVHCLGETDHKPSRIILTEVRFSKVTGFEDLTDRHILYWTHAKTENPIHVAQEYLEKLGFNLVGYGSVKNVRYIFSDSWQDGKGFKTIKGETEF